MLVVQQAQQVYHIAALGLSRQRIVNLKEVQININQSKERLRAILAKRYQPWVTKKIQ